MDIFAAVISIAILVFSSILHEVAHGYVAYRLGDPTAKLMGRLTLNPLPHIDWYMSVLLPVILFIATGGRFIFGGAKPVPVDPFNLRDGMKDIAIVSLVGPLTNIVLAIISASLIHTLFPNMSFGEVASINILGYILAGFVQWNLVLGIFNLVPIPPLDGSKLFALLLPKREAAAYLSMGSFGLVMLMFLTFFPIGGFSLMGIIQDINAFALGLLGF